MKSIDNRWIKSAVIIFAELIFISALPWRELRADAITHGEYDCSPLSVTYDQISSWDTTTQAEFTVTNTSDLAVEGWTFELDFPMDVTVSNIWNAVDLTGEEPSLVVGNQEYNSLIAPGESITFGIILEGTEFAPTAPASVTLVIETEEEITEIPEEISEEPSEEAIEPDAFSYAVFTSGDVNISGYMSNIYGDIYSGTNFIFQGSELKVEGTVRTAGAVNASGYITEIDSIEENTESLELPDLEEYIAESSADKEILSSEAFVSQTDIVANGCYYTEDSIEINAATLSGDAVIVAEEDIIINVDTIPEGTNLTLYSVNGDITFNVTEAEIKGVLYAPEGKVTVNGNEVYVTGNIVANEFEFNGSILNISVDEDVVFPTVTPTDVPEITVTDSPTETPEPTAVPTEESEVTDTPTPTVTVAPSLTETPTPTATATPTPTEESVDTELDSDGDYIPDYLEVEIGTNPNNPDSDVDGLNDYLEIMVGYDPTKADTDDNGIADGDEDLDGDNVSNLVELSIGTEMMSEDTDCDGITDGNELYVYCSNPKVPDTDGDCIYDGDELLLGKSPTDSSDGDIRVEQTKEQEFSNEEDPAISSVEVTMELSNLIDRSLRIRDMYNVNVYVTNVAGRIGSPISFECAEEFDAAIVVIHYDETKLEDTQEEDLGVLWFDEANGIFVEQEQAVVDTDANTVTLELEHFSTYILADTSYTADVPIYVQGDIESYTEVDTNYDYYFTIIANQPDDVRRNEYLILSRFVTQMNPGDRVALVYGEECNYRVTGLASTAAEKNNLLAFAQGQLSAFVDYGYGNIGGHFGAVSAVSWYIYDHPDRMNDNAHMLFILDTGYYAPQWHGDNIYRDFDIAAVIPSADCDQNDIQAGQSVWGLEVYQYPESLNLWDSFSTRHSIVSYSSEDEDGDGIPDVVEEGGMLALNGNVYYSDPTNPDTDGDTLTDGEEMGTMHRILRIDDDTVQIDRVNLFKIDEVGTSDYAYLEDYIPENPDEICFVFDIVSDPTLKDTDGDYYYDNLDEEPLCKNLETLNLGGGSYNPFIEDPGYIHVCNVPNNLVYSNGNEELCDRVFYGGNQSWFGNVTEDDLGIFQGDKLFIQESGCGMIATNDIMLYIIYGGSTLSWEDYRETVLNTYDDFFIVGFDEVYWGSSITSTMVCNAFERNSIETRTIRVNESNESDTIDEIIESLNSDIPVIMLENDAFWYDGIALYRPIFYGIQYSSFDGFINSFDDTKTQNHYHYTTITGVVECIDEVGNKHYWLRVQSWGDQCYVSYEEFVDFNNSTFKQGILIFPER